MISATAATISAEPKIHRWMQPDAVALQFNQMPGGFGDIIAGCHNPQLMRTWFVSLTLYRLSPEIQKFIKKMNADFKLLPFNSPDRHLFSMTMGRIESYPAQYPFCLSDLEFGYYCGKYFGATLPSAQTLYHPPNFLKDLVLSLVGAFIGLGIGVYTGGTSLAVQAAGALVGSQLSAGVFSSNLLSDLEMGALWSAYQIEFRRRKLK